MSTEYKGIDVSYAQGVIDWNKVKASGKVDFAIIRTGYGKFNSAKDQKDKQFESNYNGAKAAGIPVGAYHYSYAVNASDAEQEAEFCLSLLNGKQFEYPIFFDIEEKVQLALGKEKVSEIVVAFCDKIEKAGYWAAVYSFASMLSNQIEYEKIKRFDCWVAHTDVTAPSYSKPFGIWQYSHKGTIEGINNAVDLDVAYKDYPALICNARLNGFSKDDTRYSITFTDISSKDECENLAVEVGAKGYLNHRIEVQNIERGGMLHLEAW